MKPPNILIFIMFLLSIGKILGQPPEINYQGTVIQSGYADDVSYGPLEIGFTFNFCGNNYTQFYVNSNGMILFGAGSSDSIPVTIPTAAVPNDYIAPFWDDLVVDPSGKILYTTIGASPNSKLVVQFTNMGFYTFPVLLGTFQVILYETSNKIQFQYRLLSVVTSPRTHGGTATIGLENSNGTAGTLFAFKDSTALSNEQAISFTPPGPNYTVNSNALYDGIYLTTNLGLPEPGITQLISPPQDAIIGANQTFSWSSATNAASYSLRISYSSDLTGATVYDAGTNLSYDVTGLTLDTVYYWGVFATNATGTTWCQIKRFRTSSTPPLAPAPETDWVEQGNDFTIQLDYTGGDVSPKTGIITSLPVNGNLYQFNAGIRGVQITTVPTTLTDVNRKVIYAASGITGNDAGNFNFKIHDNTGDSPEATVTINVVPPGIPNVLYLAKSTTYIEIQFDIKMADPTSKQNQFTLKVNGSPATIDSAKLKTGDPYTIVLYLASTLTGTETVYAAYTQGDVAGASGGLLLSFADHLVSLTAQTINFSQSLDKKFSDSPLTLTATASSGLGMIYSSSDLAVATPGGSVLTFHSVGFSDITARQAGNVTYAPARYIKTLTVNKADQTITFDTLPVKTVGDPDFSPGATASSGLMVSYASDNPGVATIAGSLIHLVSAGTAVITASQPGNANYNAAPDVPQTLTVNNSSGVENTVISQKDFHIYPANNLINIMTLSDQWNGRTGSIKVLDLAGKTVSYVQNVGFSKNSLVQVSSPMAKGVYLIELRSGVMRFVGKVLIR